ncbi:hypothetical protein COCC4DRAFT_208575 [Bipolaris maydis ATCC 48331]|uniref:Carboxymuconolactone decarboxylase-like domain-containing protein n=2 Tax=Cochliobolus heterostrophus TaxID=5016 RepID=M2UKJ0_COCH5|nr:uncharacterized protein COCC4DRAFT_208575 [Bipolaris maydis ATCC 48331]EMD88508.1 hypothetical protein COCHEDRAFT_1226702 [Bipolaris maydis C5]KAJ5026325.1 hypothetical protein J3E73DRAFT_382304 [Bipolaris maydis]ENH99147.1 hypothetical protein COCC4DRAFT_208575 [Bipolaris maydis ATCC 48331]KAJ5051403.1 hypothetical protein J3E74DRAFT_422921 [Bipolaris maydis]KAJ6196448.1 hypothetical protein J3E72DRAFT_386886 [Bipolaris maydis]
MARTLEEIINEFRDREKSKNITTAVWYIVAAAALASSGAGPDVVQLYQAATKQINLDDQKIVQRRIKEAILKTSALYGVPRSLQALLPLFNSLKDEEIDHYGPRWEAMQADAQSRTIYEKTRYEKARRYFDTVWTPAGAQANRDKNFKYHPDLYLLNTQLVYEHYFSEDAILNPVETQMGNIAALICCNCPVQAMWHTRGLINHGGTINQAEFSHELAVAIATLYECKIGNLTPVSQIDFENYETL